MSLLGQEIYDMSDQSRARFFFHGSIPQVDSPKAASSIKPSSANICYRQHKPNGELESVPFPFPKNTRGVLYLYLPSGHSDISGQVRFRICDNVADFQQGKEPTSATPLPENRGACLYGIIDKGLISDILSLPLLRGICSPCLYDLNQPFILDLAFDGLRLSIMTRRSLETIRMSHALKDRRSTNRTLGSPYTGLVRVRFELSTLPEHVKLGPTLLLRILDIVKPVQCVIEGYDNYIAFPKAGAFVSKMYRTTGQYQPWCYPLNSRLLGKAFYTLVQNSHYGHNDTPRLASSTSVQP
ncbi:hypothetical protein BDZ97DRAFT_1911497 [Flammula alnicola]|nr:hypothetical protein BDZ97DRAFT_1911497 [Flammula alnicola]